MNPVGVASRFFDDALEWEDYLLLAAVVLLPWAFGGVEIWAHRSAALLLVTSGAIALVRGGWDGLGLDRRSRWLLPALLLGLWAAFQLVPLPPAAIEVLSPRADELYRATFPGYPDGAVEESASAIQEIALAATPEFSGLPEPARQAPGFEAKLGGRWSGWRPLSLLPDGGKERLAWYAALLVGFLVARRRCADPAVARLYRNVLFGLFLALAGFGLLYAATSNGKLYWIRETMDYANPFGPYVNPTNFAGVMELAVPWLAGYMMLNVRVARGTPLTLLRSPVVAATLVLCVLAALATGSKAGAILVGAAILALLLISVRTLKARLASLAGAAVAVALAIPILQRTVLGSRVEQFLDLTAGGYGEVGRLVGWRAAGGMLRDFLFTGSGFGSFRDVFPHYMPAGESARWAQLHNDYYEVLLEGGLVAAALLLWLLWGFGARVLRRRVWHGEPGFDPEALGLLLGLAALFVHASFDFNHQIPANALLFTTLAAMAVARGEAGAPGAAGEGR